ncbi:hypothetical protein B0H16DRAFT_1450507 [Mycena metata]|uniref:Uncharacterized protein n=1 Tax=Mycena metata TaxID=1033252 RepID=A0AAD7NU60_9AGAR|nr:hypothetical protein B0H16DRAFT_1450507 [Mycena metata]
MSPEMRAVGPPSRVTTVAQQAGMQSLVISPNLDALLEHDERIRRAAAQYAARADSPSFILPTQGLPPPPRRTRAPGSPSLLVPHPLPLPPLRSPLVSQEERDLADTPDSNPYINPAPQWLDVSATPISPPPRSSSMGVEFDAGQARGASVGSAQVGGNGDTGMDQMRQSSDDSPADSRYRPLLPKSASLPRLLKRKDDDEPPRVLRRRSRSRPKPVPAKGTDSPPQMSEIIPEHRLQPRRRRSSRSISVSSAISTDRESFIDLFSPSNQDFPADFTTGPFTAASPTPSTFPRNPKPPVPTTPKPDFRRRTTTPVPAPQRRPSPNPVGPPAIPVRALPPDAMPPTTNFLNPSERAQLIKKSRKLAQVFGQTPGPADLDPTAARSSFLDVAGPSTISGSGGSSGRVRHRAAASMNMVGQMPPAQRPLPPWPAAEKTIKMTVNGRRHSTSSAGVLDDNASVMTTTTEFAMPSSDDGDGGPSSPRSFMDFSNTGDSNSNSHEDEGSAEVGPDDSISVFLEAQTTPRSKSRSKTTPGIPPSPSSPSLFENMTPEEQAEEERKRKRDKLAKLHRFLGSRVPTSLVLGLGNELGEVLPPPQIVVGMDGTLDVAANDSFLRSGGTGSARGASWVSRRRSSSAAVLSTWSDEVDRVKEDLNDKEKAIIVKRAQKMEKVFGVAPPQMLYSAHHSPTASASAPRSAPGTPPSSPPASYSTGSGSGYGQILAQTQQSGSRNPNQTPYQRSSSNPSGSWSSRHNRKSHNGRPGTGDSGTFLLADAEPSAGSFVYTHYQHSLNSLHDIIDRNDKESLAELHQYLNDTSPDAAPLTSPTSPLEFSGSSNGSVHSGNGSGSGGNGGGGGGRPKAERRRSLPARTSTSSLASYASASSIVSLTSLASVNTVTGAADSASIGGDDFQQRRKRAAKLTQFFGVDYRDLIEDVLESIEHGLDAERRRGTLNAAEAEALLQKLRTLKARR